MNQAGGERSDNQSGGHVGDSLDDLEPPSRPFIQSLSPSAGRRAHTAFHRLGITLAGLAALAILLLALGSGGLTFPAVAGMAIVGTFLYALSRALGWIIAAVLGD